MVMKKYIDNIMIFKEKYLKDHRDLFLQLEDGQTPDTIMITCSDSRIVPHMKAGALPGDMFIFRNMGNFVPPYHEGEDDPTGIAAFLEYGVQFLGARNIIVMGHTNCGAIKGIFQSSAQVDKSLFIKSWLRNGDAVKRIVMEGSGSDDDGLHAERGFTENVKLQVEHIKTYPFIRNGEGNGMVMVHGWLYDVKTADILYLREEEGDFQPLTQGR